MTKRKRRLLIIFGVFATIVVLLGFYFHYENNTLQVTHYTITSDDLPAAFDNYKIVQISDFHNTKSQQLTRDLVTNIAKQDPDLIVITGDLIDSRRTDIPVALNFVQTIRAYAPVYYVPGNHEARLSDYQSFQAALTQAGAIVLDNQATTITIDGAEINLLGINDPAMSDNTYATNETIIADEIDNFTYHPENFSILLSHRPELFDTYVTKQIDLIFTGHAHGGQIRLPFIGGLVAPSQGLFPKYTSGTFTQDRTTMVISRGIGNSILPWRIHNRPELVVATLKNAH